MLPVPDVVCSAGWTKQVKGPCSARWSSQQWAAITRTSSLASVSKTRSSYPRRSGARFYEEITGTCSVALRVVSAGEIDYSQKVHDPECTARPAACSSHNRPLPDLAYVDACDVIAERYGHMVTNFLGCECRVVAEHHADESFPLVSAASIVAKVIRDREIEALAAKYGDIGSGYPSDQRTVDYLSAVIQHSGKPPVFARARLENGGEDDLGERTNEHSGFLLIITG